jgi:hypothetical protein
MLCRVSAVLYLLLLDHPIDRRGRCRSCRRPGARIALRRRSCLIHLRANYWLLRQPDKAILLAHLADHLGLDHASAPSATTPPDRSSRTMTALIDPRATDVLPTAVSDVADPPQTPTVAPRLRPADSLERDGRALPTMKPRRTPTMVNHDALAARW